MMEAGQLTAVIACKCCRAGGSHPASGQGIHDSTHNEADQWRQYTVPGGMLLDFVSPPK
jgi:hypothetical protein